MKYDQENDPAKRMYRRLFEIVTKEVPQSTVPEGRQGPWEVKKFMLTDDDVRLPLMRAMARGERGYTPPGDYTRLAHDKRGIVMSDTLDELSDHRFFVYRAEGNLLINGLGLGCCLAAVLRKAEVKSVTVVEIDQDVIDLVGPHFKDDARLTLINDDALAWEPPKGCRYDAVWHDIWDTISGDNKPTMHKLHRRFGRRSTWQDSWGAAQMRSGLV